MTTQVVSAGEYQHPTRYYRMAVLSHADSKTYVEIGRMMGLSATRVRAICDRARWHKEREERLENLEKQRHASAIEKLAINQRGSGVEGLLKLMAEIAP